MKMNFWRPALAAAVALSLGACCCSSENQPAAQDETAAADTVVCTNLADSDTAASMLTADAAKLAESVQPGQVYLSPSLAPKFLLDPAKILVEYNEDAVLSARIYGKTKEKCFIVWLVSSVEEYNLAYRFVWFDSNGRIVEPVQPVQTRRTLPGNPVRFSSVSPSGACKKVSFIAAFADELPAAPAAPAEAE